MNQIVYVKFIKKVDDKKIKVSVLDFSSLRIYEFIYDYRFFDHVTQEEINDFKQKFNQKIDEKMRKEILERNKELREARDKYSELRNLLNY